MKARFLFIALLLQATLTAALVHSPHGKMKMDCRSCHNTRDWTVRAQSLSFKHERTGFPLIGAHAKTSCRDCHQDLRFAHIGSSCIDCHTDIHRGQLGDNCQRCHTFANWENRQQVFDQHARTRFPLFGVHAIADCEACHTSDLRDEFVNTPLECQGCHIDAYRQSLDPDHKKAGFSDNCRQCHSVTASGWQVATYQHTQAFPLKGGHQALRCIECHSDQYSNLSQECYACHQTDYQGTREPNHTEFGFLTDCTLCHNEVQWQGSSFDHLTASGFALIEAHNTLKCTQCHQQNQLTGLPRDCFGCHESDYSTVTDPNHAAGGYPRDCTTCHTQTAWTPATFDHNTTDFALTGKHQTVGCAECHVNNVYTGTPKECWSCHEEDYNGVQDPNHLAGAFDHDCTVCHSTNAWQPSTFDHNATQFPLDGAHTSVACATCHAEGYAGTATDCWSCHQSDYNGVQDPNHITNNFDHDCSTCHSTSAWQPATFDHNLTAFALTGAHISVACSDCHTDGYANTPQDCYFCHEKQYIGTNDPNHAAAQFPQQCENCHNTTDWGNTTWDHDNQYFPIYSGEHQDEWNTCGDCHVNSADYSVFECITCHDHNQTKMDDEHNEVADYQYLSSACYQCHPKGKKEGDDDDGRW